jgi:MFS family permease
MVLGALGTFCNSLVGSFACLLLCRGAAGAALGGLLPASYAMLADMYPAEEMTKVEGWAHPTLEKSRGNYRLLINYIC